jgi:hypothetical protein
MKKQLSIVLILVLTLSLFAGCRMKSNEETSMPTNETTTMPTTTQMPTTSQAPSTVPSTGDSGMTEIPGGTGSGILDGGAGDNAPNGSAPTENGRIRIPSARMK